MVAQTPSALPGHHEPGCPHLNGPAVLLRVLLTVPAQASERHSAIHGRGGRRTDGSSRFSAGNPPKNVAALSRCSKSCEKDPVSRGSRPGVGKERVLSARNL